MKKSVHEYAFADKIVPSEDGGFDCVTKAEVAVMAGIQAWQTVRSNMRKLCIISETAMRHACGSNYLHLLRQIRKESNDKFTEIAKMFVLYDKQYFLIRAYKFVDEDYFKVEVTKGLYRNQPHMLLELTLGTSLYLLEEIMKGAEPWMVPHYMHRKDFMPVTELLGRY